MTPTRPARYPKNEMSLEEYHAWKARPRAPRGDAEYQEQAALFEWAAYTEPRLPDLQWLYHTPSGEYRDKRTAMRLQAMGVKRGIPDALLPVLRYDPALNVVYTGFAGELKAPGGTTSDDQERWLAHYAQQGWQTGVYVGWVPMASAIVRYLGHEPGEFGL